MNPTAWNPGTLLQTSGYYWKTCTLHTGVKLDIFSINMFVGTPNIRR